MKKGYWAAFFVLGLCGPAQAAYITDSIEVKLLSHPDRQSETVDQLTSGAPIRILQQQSGWTQVERPNGQQGWLETKYVAENQTAEQRLLALQSTHRQLQRDFQDNQKQIQSLERRLSELTPTQADQVPESTKKTRPEPGALPWPIWSGLLVLLFSAGVLLGRFWEDRKQRHRHHGFRV